MRVLHIIERFNPNLGQEINFIAKNKSADIELTILTSTSLRTWNIDNYRDVENEDDAYRKTYGVTIIRLNTLFEYGEKIWLKNLHKTVKSISPDVIYIHGIEYISFARVLFRYFLKRRNAYQLFTDTHSLPVFTSGTLFRSIYYFYLTHIIIPIVNKLKVVTFYTAEENSILLKDYYRLNKSLIKPFQIGADLKTFLFNPLERENLRREYNISNDNTVILFTGRICRAKGPHLILDALWRIDKSLMKDITLLFIGFKDKTYVENVFNRFLSQDFRVIIEEPKPSGLLFKYYSAADFAVFPLESTLSSLECQACKLPVIMEDNLTNRNRISKGGLTYKSGDLGDLSEKILLLIMDISLRKELSERGYEYVANNYNYAANLKRMEEVLRDSLI
jgi:glycosyltransferase involved in cell wall biosynthesis